MRLHRPPPIRTDGTNEFARYSMQVRVPRIARDTLARQAGASPVVRRSVETLARAIEDNELIPPPRPPGPDVQAWARACEAHAGERWLDAEWFYAELAFYREMVLACRFWETGVDPFEPFKVEEIEGERLWTRVARAQSMAQRSREDRIASLLDASLWANRVDLSYAVAATDDAVRDADLLVDDRARAAPVLARDGAHVHIVADNAGTELGLDLVLADELLASPSCHVTMHLKMEPTFVSDAMPEDVWHLVRALEGRPGAPRDLASRLRAAFEARRWILRPDPFWSGPGFMHEAPGHLTGALSGATMVVFKGDANYRRVVGDALWPPDAPFEVACEGLGYSLLCLRTMKSDALLGLPPGLAEELDRGDPRWRIDGRRGVAQAWVRG